MNIHRFSGQVLEKSFFVVLLVLLIFQSFGINALAAQADSQQNLQQEGDSRALTCTIPIGSSQTPTFCNIQIVLMIDDSGSMTTNDPQNNPNGGLRNQGAKNVVDLLATQYYLPAVQLIEKLNSENPDLKLEAPVVQVAVIHFTNAVKNTNVEWMDIAPGSLEEWTNDPNNGQKAIHDVIDLQYANLYQLTSFIEPFERASNLLENPGPGGNCTRRSIMLFTDGVPEDRNGRLRDTPRDATLSKHMEAVAGIVTSIQENQKKQDDPNDVEIYITGFKIIPTYWTPVAERWTEIAKSASGEDTPTHTELLEGNNSLAQLPSRMEAIAAKLTGLQRKEHLIDSFSTKVPKHVQTLRFTLYDLDPRATLVITDPTGQTITADDDNVTVSGDDTAIEKWDLNFPIPGDYQVEASMSGGIVTELLTYQNLTVEFNPDPARLQESKPSDVKFKLLDSAGNVVLSGDDPAYTLDLNVFVTQDNQTEKFVDWSVVGDEYQVTWTPPKAGVGLFSVEANLVGVNNEKLLNCTGTVAERPVDPLQPGPEPGLDIDSPEPSCVPPGEVITIPVHLVYEGDDRSWADSLQWNISATAVPDNGQAVQASISTVNVNSGDYEVRIDPVEAEEIRLVVSGEAEIDGHSVKVSDNRTLTITICQPAPPPLPCFPVWLIFIWLLMGLFILLLGWVILRDVEINIHVWMLVALEVVMAVIWFVLFIDYRIHLLWMLLLLAILILFLFLVYRRVIEEILSWWLIIVLTLYVSIWFIVFGNFTIWLSLLIFLMWLGILVAVWIFLQGEPPRIPWLLLVLLLILVLIAIIYFSAYWIFLLLWLLVIALVIVLIRVIGPICPPPPGPTTRDDLKIIEGIGPKVEEILNEHGIYTFEQLANADVNEVNRWFDEAKSKGRRLSFTRPYTWPQQAKLADKAKKSGKPEDWDAFYEETDRLKGGLERDMYNMPEKSTKQSRPSKRNKPEGGDKPPKTPK